MRHSETLRPSPEAYVGTLFLCLFCCALCLSSTSSSAPERYGFAALFLLYAAYAGAHFIPGGSFLRLDAEGFDLKTPFRKPRRIPFAEIAKDGFFIAVQLPFSSPRVAWRPLKTPPGGAFWKDMLSSDYGDLSAGQLADLLNMRLEDWRKRAR